MSSLKCSEHLPGRRLARLDVKNSIKKLRVYYARYAAHLVVHPGGSFPELEISQNSENVSPVLYNTI